MQKMENGKWKMSIIHYPLSSSRKAQTILEYAIFVSVIVAALMTMAVYVRRAIQANLRQVQERVNAEAVD